MKIWNATIVLLPIILLGIFSPGALASVVKVETSGEATLDEACSSDDRTCIGSSSYSDAEIVGEKLPPCEDRNDGCQYWAEAGECLTNPRYMYVHCAQSCGLCLPEK